MAKRIGGSRRKTRQKLSKPAHLKGKISLTSYFAQYAIGDMVAFVPEPAVHGSLSFARRFTGRAGVVESKRGACYEIVINDGGKAKHFIIHPVHLKRI